MMYRANFSNYPASDPNLWLKRGIWLYLLLLIFEGALRKWFLPALATPLLVVRDPIALWLIFSAWNKGILPKSYLLKAMVVIGLLGIFTALLFGHGNLTVAVFGARTLIVHFPMIFVIGSVMDKEDVLKIGQFLLWTSIPMVLLIALQFYSPQSAFVNRGVGGDNAGAGFSGAMGYLRPPGTFSFTNGTHLFYGLTGSFILYFWLNPKGVNKLLLCGATMALIAVIPLSISRTLGFMISISAFFALITVLRKPENFLRVVLAGTGVLVILMVLSNFSFFQTATKVLTLRFTNASYTEGGLKGTLGNRYFGWMAKAISTSLDQPFFGHGLGLGTNVGSALLTGDRKFLVSEEEWNRQIGELGALMGIGVILIRVALTFKMGIHALKNLQNGEMLPWMLLSFGLTVIPQGQWAQPTALGFSVLTGGLIIAAMHPRTETDDI
jgi:hypothetical protein